jgi:hypothetical protein
MSTNAYTPISQSRPQTPGSLYLKLLVLYMSIRKNRRARHQHTLHSMPF